MTICLDIRVRRGHPTDEYAFVCLHCNAIGPYVDKRTAEQQAQRHNAQAHRHEADSEGMWTP